MQGVISSCSGCLLFRATPGNLSFSYVSSFFLCLLVFLWLRSNSSTLHSVTSLGIMKDSDFLLTMFCVTDDNFSSFCHVQQFLIFFLQAFVVTTFVVSTFVVSTAPLPSVSLCCQYRATTVCKPLLSRATIVCVIVVFIVVAGIVDGFTSCLHLV